MNAMLITTLTFLTLFSNEPITLSTGETLNVNILSQDEHEMVVEHEVLGIMTIPIEKVSTPTRTVHQNVEPEIEEQVQTIETPSPWSQRVTLGFGYQQSQFNSMDVSASYHAEKRNDMKTIAIDVSYRFSESEDVRTRNWLDSSIANTWHGEKNDWDVFTTLKFDWSEFQSWDQRLIADGGFEFHLWSNDEIENPAMLKGRIGLGARQEFQSFNEDLIPEGLFGLKYKWEISKSQSLTADSTWFPDLNDSENYRVVTNAKWNMQLESVDNLRLSIGLHHEYDSIVASDVKNDFLHVTAGIEYAF
ncbi:MAG: DUF481 domain-containing protein [Planctomycetota bacterium]|nr:DUF481 domain-containing protein [Planctomycetota bacterium]